jgi:hypothetical protein
MILTTPTNEVASFNMRFLSHAEAPPYTKSINYLQPKSLNVENVKISMGNQRRLYIQD